MRKIVVLTLLLLLSAAIKAQITPENDTLFYKQEALFEKLNIFNAWEITKGDATIHIGCIDNGFDFYHPYLNNSLIPGYYHSGSYHPLTFSSMAHGTLVSSIMVANPKSESGMSGLAPNCKVLTASFGSINHIIRTKRGQIENGTMQDAIRELQRDTTGVNSFVAKWNNFSGNAMASSILYLVDNGVRVINISGELFGAFDGATKTAIEEALNHAYSRDVLVVVSAGNKNMEIHNDWSINRDNIIVVGALNDNDEQWTMSMNNVVIQGSNWGEMVDLSAPTENLVVCIPSDERFYSCDDGPMGSEEVPYRDMICDVMPVGATSSAAPIVSSLAALIYSIAPDMSAVEVKRAIIEGCDDVGAEGYDLYTGHGRVNFGNSLSYVINMAK